MARYQRLGPDARRRAILDAAAELFAQRGYAAVSLGEVAAAAGVTRGLLHHYFESARGLQRAVAQTLLEQAADAIRLDLTDLPPEEMVHRNVAAWLDHFEAHRGAVEVLNTLPGSDPELEALVDGAREATIDRILLNHFGTTDVAPGLRLVLRGFTALALAACHEWLWRGRATRPEVQALLETALLGLVRDAVPAVAAVSGAEARGG